MELKLVLVPDPVLEPILVLEPNSVLGSDPILELDPFLDPNPSLVPDLKLAVSRGGLSGEGFVPEKDPVPRGGLYVEKGRILSVFSLRCFQIRLLVRRDLIPTFLWKMV